MYYKVYYKLANNFFRVYDGSTIETCKYRPEKVSVFEMTKKGGYTATDESLIKYYSDIKVASDELNASKELENPKNPFDYLGSCQNKDGSTFYRTHNSNVLTILKMKSPKAWRQYEKIDAVEANWFEKCHNGGIQYCQVGEHDSYGYDFNMYYPRLLGDKNFTYFQFPTKKGKEQIITNLDSIQYGFYRVKIHCDDANISKVFKFSKDDVYTHYSLKFAFELRKKHNFNMDIELIQDDEPNAYIYNEADLIDSPSIFQRWFNCVYYLKKKYPKNILVKMISSSIWGHLSESNTIYVNKEDIHNYDVDLSTDADYQIIDIIMKQDGSTTYELLDTKNPYKHPMRLKPFITSYGRNKTARVALRMIDNVIRIHTDGICFNKPYALKSEHFHADDKYTGRLKFNSIKSYERL
jgi:hypothetical protein